MRREVDKERLHRFLEALGKAVRGPGRAFLTGGATALDIGWRGMTKDVDLSFDPYTQALSKIERGHSRDLADVAQMFGLGLVDPDRLGELFARLEVAQILRYPRIDPDALREKVRRAIEGGGDDGEP